jgi:hypothetical protein
MTKARDLAELIGNSLIDGDEIAIGAVGTSNLAATLDFSSKTMVMANDQLSGDKIHGGTVSAFTSTGIDDNATVNILTVSDTLPLLIKKTGSTSAVQEFLRLENSAGGGAGAGSSINFHHYHAGGGPTGGAKAASITAQNMASWPGGTPSSYSSGLTFGTLHENTFAERMRIHSSGKVGIGTDDPTSKLTVNSGISSSQATVIDIHQATNGADKQVASIGVLINNGGESTNAGGMFFQTASGGALSERMRLTSSGGLELGYSGAARQQADSQAFTITTPANGGGQGIALKRLDSNNDQVLGSISWSNNTQDGLSYIVSKTDGATNTTDIKLQVSKAGTLVTALMLDGSEGGKAWFSGQIRTDRIGTSTNSVDPLLYLNAKSSNTTVAGFGPGIVFAGDRNGDGVTQQMAQINAVAEVNSGTTLSSGLQFKTASSGVNQEVARFTNDRVLQLNATKNYGSGTTFPSYTALGGHIHGYVNGSGTTYPRYLDIVSIGEADGSKGGNIRLLTSPNGSTTGIERVRINQAGNVGIGTDTPNAFLSVRKDNSNSGNQFVVADTEGATGAVRTYTHNNDDSGLILNHYYAVEGSGSQYMRYADFVANVGNGAGTTMRFITKNAANTYSTGLKIDNNGKVYVNSGYSSGNFGMYIQGKGSGVADARALHVRGYGGHTTIGGTGPTLVLQNADGTTNNITKLSFETASNGEAVSINCFNTDHGNFYGDMAFNTRGSLGYSEKLRIMANGNVGIGTTTPAEKLQVVGNVDVRGALSVSSGGFGSQLYTSANAASNPNGNEANATTGWAAGYTGASMSSVGTENSVTPTNGSYQLKYTGTNNGARMDYGFQVVAGKRYELTLNSDWYQGSLYTLVYVATSNSGDNLGAAISSIEALNGTSYAQKRLTFGATLSGTVYLSLRMASTSSPQNITYIDNISIKEIVGADIFAQDQFLSGRLSVANTIVAPNQIGFRARGNTSQWLNLATPSSGAAWNKITNTIHAGDGTDIGVNLTTATKNNFNCWNTGNDFSLGTGTFTAAVAGIYAISFTMYGQKNSSASASDFCYALPYINGQQINEMYAGVGANETPAPGDFMINYSHTIQLEVGDYLSFQVYANSKNVQMYGDHCSCGAELLH